MYLRLLRRRYGLLVLKPNSSERVQRFGGTYNLFRQGGN
jgi:hypothetical protein